MFPSFILLALSLTSGNCVLTEGVEPILEEWALLDRRKRGYHRTA